LKAIREDALLFLHIVLGSKLINQKIQRNEGKVAPPIRILAIEDLRVFRTQRQVEALSK
jgi:hypothetical protein